MATGSLAKRIVSLDEDVKKLKTAQFAYGKQYIGMESQVVIDGTVRYTPARTYTLQATFAYEGESDFPLVGLRDFKVYFNGVEQPVGESTFNLYGEICYPIGTTGTATASLSRYIEGDETLSFQNYYLDFLIDTPDTSLIPENTAIKFVVTLVSNSGGKIVIKSITQY